MSDRIAHFVTCVHCGIRFDRDKHDFVAISSRRYAHQECYEREKEKLEQSEKDRLALEEYIIKNICKKEGYVTARVQKQIKSYIKDYNYTYSGMLKTLIYFYEVQGNSFEKANGGVGIIPHVYEKACTYYYSIWLANQQSENFTLQDFEIKKNKVKIPSPKRENVKRKLFSFLDKED